MSRPPLKAMKAVKRYCEKKKDCDGCPIHVFDRYGCCLCFSSPEHWKIKKEGEKK